MATYYIDGTSGNDSNTGLSDAQAWLTLTNVTGLATSDKVYIKCGTEVSETGSFTVDWGGTSGDYAVVGSYYMDGGVETVGVSGNRGKIVGGFGGTYAELPTTDLDYNYNGTVYVTANYTRIQDLWIYRCVGVGILVGSSGNGLDSIHIKNNLIDETQMSSVQCYSNWTDITTNAIIEDNTFQYACLNGGKVWSWPGVCILWKGSSGIIRNNVFKYNYGEQVMVGDDSSIYGNEFYNYHALGVYLHWAQNNSIYNNMFYGSASDDAGYPSGNRDFTRYSGGGTEYVSEAIAWGEEYESGLQVASNNKIYNNLAASLINFLFTTLNNDADSIFDGYVYHNTIVDCYNAFHFTGVNAQYSGAIKNNIIADYTGGLGTIVAAPTGLVPSNVDWDYNCWHTLPDADARGANDLTDDAELSKNSGWQAIATYGDVTSADWALTGTSPCIDTGLQIAGYLTDYNGQTRGSGTTDMGAMEYAAAGGWTLNSALSFVPKIYFMSDFLTGYGGPFYPFSVYPVSTDAFFDYYVGSGANSKQDFGLRVKASIVSDTIWRLRFAMPPEIPSGTPRFLVRSLASGTGDAQINVKYASVAVGEDPSSATLTAEGTSTVTWTSGDAGKYKETLITLDGVTFVANEIIVMDLTFEA